MPGEPEQQTGIVRVQSEEGKCAAAAAAAAVAVGGALACARVLRGTQAVAAARVGGAVAWRQRTVGATRGRDVPERRVPRAVHRPGFTMRPTTLVMRANRGRVAACLAHRLVRDVPARRAIPLLGGGSADECECEDYGRRPAFGGADGPRLELSKDYLKPPTYRICCVAPHSRSSSSNPSPTQQQQTNIRTAQSQYAVP